MILLLQKVEHEVWMSSDAASLPYKSQKWP